MSEPVAFAVAIPAHNEERTIGRALDAVFAAAVGRRVAVVVAADACHDGTADVVRACTRRTPRTVSLDVVEVELRCAGAARQVAAAAAVRRITRSLPADDACWLASTDADSTVPANWLETHRRWARHGADAVTGLVRIDEHAALVSRVRNAVDREFATARLGHQHVYGANLGVAVPWWDRVGGFPLVETGEDQRFDDHLRAEGARVVAADDSVVTTSGRLVARAPGGFGARLARLTAVAAQIP